MKRFHVHVSVKNLDASIAFYSNLFGQSPTKEKPDYAKWMLDDPRVNFAISSRGHAAGVNHFGFQADSVAELEGLKQQAEKASQRQVLDQSASACCYAKSEKHWTTDPEGLAWENFYTIGDAEAFGVDSQTESGACCIPVHDDKDDSGAARAGCCVPNAKETQGSCCA